MAKKYKQLAYVSSPYSGDVEKNTERARKYCRYVYEHLKMTPVAPHLLYPQFMDDTNEKERKHGLRMACRLLDKCDIVIFFDDEMSPGMEIEYQRAVKKNKEILKIDVVTV